MSERPIFGRGDGREDGRWEAGPPHPAEGGMENVNILRASIMA